MIGPATDGSGAEVGTTQYDAVWAIRAQTVVQLPFGYTGQQQDGETSLIYLRARVCAPKTRWVVSESPRRSVV